MSLFLLAQMEGLLRLNNYVTNERAMCPITQHRLVRFVPRASFDFRWLALVTCLLGVSGCQRSAPVEYVSSKQVQQLEPSLQQAVRGELAKLCGTHAAPKLLGGTKEQQAELKFGQQVYEHYCMPCHGASGDGAGLAAPYLNPRPRDYRRGIFKFTSAPYGSRPRREDLIRTVTRGIAGTSMPSFSRLPKRELDAVVDYVLALTRRGELEQLLAVSADAEGELDDEMAEEMANTVINRWKQAEDQVVEPATKMPPMTAESIAQGAEIFQKRECFKCHGRNGRGGLVGGHRSRGRRLGQQSGRRRSYFRHAARRTAAAGRVSANCRRHQRHAHARFPSVVCRTSRRHLASDAFRFEPGRSASPRRAISGGRRRRGPSGAREERFAGLRQREITMSVDDKQHELEMLRARVRQLETELAPGGKPPAEQWQARGYYTAYHATTGFLLGGIAAMSSLLFNVVGSLLFEKQPLELIRVYLTFPMGAQALDFNEVNNGLILAIGCCLYIGTGMLYGMLFQLVLTLFTAGASVTTRFVVVSVLALALWIVNFYVILSWLQPLLFGGRWIVDQIPWWVAALTHLVFGWTMLLVYPLGRYTPYRLETRNT